jgi:esterase/lipase superfamily enzyme
MPTTVFFASNRVLTGAADDPASYGPDLQPPSSSAGMVYGSAFVDGIDVATNAQGVVSTIETTNLGSFPQSAIDDLSKPGRNLLVFIHGFDNSFTDAITRAAFNREWMAASGVAVADTTVIAFSWPSLGQIISFPILTADYKHDQTMARNSGIHLMTFLANLEPILTAARANGCSTFLLAHSMGNLALESAVENWFLHGNGRGQLFDLALLAAGDCAYDAFNQPDLARLSGLSLLAKRVSVLYSHADQVLQLSAFVNGGAQRLGQDGPNNRSDPVAFPPSVYTMVDCTGFQDYDFGPLTSHQYYRLSPKARAVIAAEMGQTGAAVAAV